MTGPWNYRLYGLNVRSELELPELRPHGEAATPDVVVRLGGVADAFDHDGLHVSGEDATLSVKGIARYRIRGGHEIVVESAREIPPRNVRLYLLGSAFGALLHQRGLLPLHANAIEIGGRAVAFMGKSGSGKSTLAAWFHDRGHRVIADDVCVVRFDQRGTACVAPGLPRLRLWKEALELSGRDPTGFDRSYAGDEEWDKFDVPMTQADAAETELGAVYLLDRGSALLVRRLSGVAAVEPLAANTYRGAYVERIQGRSAYWRAYVDLAQRVPIFAAERPWGFEQLDEVGERLLEHAVRSLAGELPAAAQGQ